MNRSAAKQVAREIADQLESGFYGTDTVEMFQRWLLLLCPPRKSPKVRSKGVKARRATVRELDALCREIIFKRDGNKCRKCGRSDGKLDWAHVHSRRFRGTRWALKGSMVLCRGCHLWWHQVPTEATEWWRGQVGASSAMLLEQQRRATKTDLALVKLHLLQERNKYA